MSFIEITEDWVKDRVKITKEKLDDIKSLSLPGTFDEKIIDLGTALNHFTRLKELDLSRNVLENLNGLSHLQCLESLNLYYNNVASLKELYKLRNNQKLTQLDLRLNPVARNETDYRLCLIHMLPLLIRLDDRCVKDEERKASLMYFGSDQSREFSPEKSEETIQTNEKTSMKSLRKTHPRVDMVNRWTKGVLAENYLDKDTFHDDMLQLNLGDVQSASDLPREREIRSVKEYSPRVPNTKRLDVEREINSYRSTDRMSNFSTIPVFIRPDDKNVSNYFDKSKHNDFAMHHQHLPDRAHGDGFGVGVGGGGVDPIIKSASLPEHQSSERQRHSLGDSTSYPAHTAISDNRDRPDYIHNGSIEADIPQSVTDNICDQVDRYWNGSRSLHRHPKFVMSIQKIIQSHCSSTNTDHPPNRTSTHTSSNYSQVKPTHSTNPNSQSMMNHDASDDSNDDIKQSNKALRQQIRELRQKLKVSEKFIEITELLRQSHESLITTNEQLRKQIDSQSKRNNTVKNE